MATELESRGELSALPPVQGVTGPHVPCVQVGQLVFFSGVLPLLDGKIAVEGIVGREVSLEEASRCGRLCAIQLLARLVDHLGGLDRVAAIAKLTVFVASDPAFTRHSEVANSVSATLEEYLGSAARHTRSAIGVASLPKGAPVEVEGVIAVAP